MFSIDDINSRKGEIAIITGANIGLGFETAKAFAKKDITVIMACRSEQKAQDAITAINQEVPQADLHFISLDLSSFDSVKAFASIFNAKYNQLHYLINNAGIMIPPLSYTKDGFESQMGVNYLSHFLLTNLLLPILKETKGARVVTLSSKAHESGEINFDDINSKKSYSKIKAYGQSKLACLMFAIELDKRLKKAGIEVASLAAHPGVSNTNLGRHIPKILMFLLYPIFSFMIHSPKNAAMPTVQAALDPNAKSGEYYGPTGRNEMKGPSGKVQPKPHALDADVSTKLWELSENLTGEAFII